jgi:hypothetical protein
MISGICPFCGEPATARNGCIVCLDRRRREFQQQRTGYRILSCAFWLVSLTISVGAVWLFWFVCCWLWERGGR